jgi:RNAse (barnase) inhibitor barstar
MATFDQQDLDGADWPIFQNGWVQMYWKSDILEQDLAWLSADHYQVHRLDCENWSSKADALGNLGSTLEFPEYYGQNLDAFNDCLGDLKVPMDGGAVLVLIHYDRFAHRDPQTAHAILDICADNARRFMLFGQRLATFVQSDDPRLEFDSVGSTPVMWNRKEWPNAKRGL